MESMMQRAVWRPWLVLLVVSGTLSGQATMPRVCDKKLATPPAGSPATPDYYGVRGSTAKWCEGIFKAEVGNPELLLEAFTQVATPPLDTAMAASLDTLTVEWNAPAGTAVHIVARKTSTAGGSYYQMDAEGVTGANGAGTWKWPVATLRGYKRWPVEFVNRPSTLSVQALALIPPATSAGDSVYIPVRIAPRTVTANPKGPLKLSVYVTEAVDSPRAQLLRVTAGAEEPVAMAPNCPALKGGSVGGSILIVTVCMPQGAADGFYKVNIIRKRDGEMTKPTVVRFYYAEAK